MIGNVQNFWGDYLNVYTVKGWVIELDRMYPLLIQKYNLN